MILYTWIFSGALAGLAGVMAGAITDLRPELGFELLLPIFAAVILGGIGDAFGALAAGMVLGVMTEWSTLIIDAALEGRGRLRRAGGRADHPPAGDLREGEGDMSPDVLFAPLAVSFEAFTQPGFWIGVGVIAGIYALVALGLQLNVGFTGIVNFGQAAFMAIGAYSMAILVREGGAELLAGAASRDLDHDGLRPADRAAGAAAAGGLLRDRDDRAWRRWCACSPRTPAR